MSIWRNIRISTFQVIALGFFGCIMTGTVLLMLPVSIRYPGEAGFMDSLFTAVSAVCGTGQFIIHLTTYPLILHKGTLIKVTLQAAPDHCPGPAFRIPRDPFLVFYHTLPRKGRDLRPASPSARNSKQL